MATDKLRHHPVGSTLDIKGVDKSEIVTSDAYNDTSAAGTNDALSANSDVSNKPGSSIPSIFGRMIFFRTALKNVRVGVLNVTGTVPVYDQIVSQWLDLLELIFNRSRTLSLEQWNFSEQIDRLKKSGHTQLADTFDKHVKKYFGTQLTNIFIISDKKTKALIGGTSPYTIVFTSPNWKSGQPVQSLLQRQRPFREFMYRLYRALYDNTALPSKVKVRKISVTGITTYVEERNATREILGGMLDYLGRCLAIDPDASLRSEINDLTGKYDLNMLYGQYPPMQAVVRDAEHMDDEIERDISVVQLRSLTYDAAGNEQAFPVVDIKLITRSPGNIQSDFFIDSDFHKSAFTTDLPLIIEKGSRYSNMHYYDNEMWDVNTMVPQVENREEAKRDMPGCPAYAPNWLTSVDFLEEKLISLPYAMSESKFRGVKNVKINGMERSFLLPLKPKALKYLRLDTLLRGLTFTVDPAANTAEVKLEIPVRNNAGTVHNTVCLSRRYKLATDVVTATEQGPMEEPVSIGISPFIRISDDSQNRYDVYLQYPTDDRLVENVDVEFFKAGSDKDFHSNDPLPVTERRGDTEGRFYKVLNKSFDAVRLVMDNVGGMVFPDYDTPNLGALQYYYAIDFGTTNTHIAFITDRTGDSAKSFDAEQIKKQAVYLAEKPDARTYMAAGHTQEQYNQLLRRLYGPQSHSTLIDQARAFFPNFEQDDYSFPIRTAAYEEQNIKDDLFGCLSIGFRYPKEKLANSKYRTSLKWDLNSPRVADAATRASMFFEELLGMIRVHWLSNGDASPRHTPTIILTYPLAMSNSAQLNRLWAQAYAKVFGMNNLVEAQAKIKQLAESLAPAKTLIADGAMSSQGILNVDIGGGTTDIQYYCRTGNSTVAKYNSVLYAGDDLWGCGSENVYFGVRNVTQNVFTRFADANLASHSIQLGLDSIDYNTISLSGKEKINMLLRDQSHRFADMVHDIDNGNSAARKVVMLHYAALMYHVANWIMADAQMSAKFPAVINFTGYGSKYIEMLFGQGHDADLTLYTRVLLEAFGVMNIPATFKVQFAENPKAVTAEGAAICALEGGVNVPQRATYHFGFAGCRPNDIVHSRDLLDLAPKVMEHFDRFLTAFDSAEHHALNLPSLTESERRGLREAAKLSYEQVVANLANPNDVAGANRVTDSLFFWALKDALYNFDQYIN